MLLITVSIETEKIKSLIFGFYLFRTWYGLVFGFTSPASPSGSAHMVHYNSLQSLFFLSAEEEAALKGATFIFQKLSCRCYI